MPKTGLKAKAKSALFWNTINQVAGLGSRFIVTMVLARLLTPADFGMIAMILVITSFSDIFINSGFDVGIIQKNEISETELSTVFYLNIIIGFCFTLLFFSGAPVMGAIYHNPEIVSLTMALSFVYFLKSFSIVQRGLVNRMMDFKSATIAQSGSQILAGVVAIIAAYYGAGVWALVIDLLLQAVISTLLFWIFCGWRPQKIFMFTSIKELWKFSSNLLGMNLLANFGNRVDLFFIGKFFLPDIVGFYSKSKDFAMLPATISTNIINTSLFPILSRIHQENKERFNDTYIRTLEYISFIFAPLFALMFLCGHELVYIFLGSQWGAAVPFFRLFAIMAFIYTLEAQNVFTLNATGRSDLNFKRTLILSPIRILIYILIPFIIKPFVPVYFIYVLIIMFIINNLINTYLIGKVCIIPYVRILISGGKYLLICFILCFLFEWIIPEQNNILVSFVIKSISFIFIYGFFLFFIKDTLITALFYSLKQKIGYAIKWCKAG